MHTIGELCPWECVEANFAATLYGSSSDSLMSFRSGAAVSIFASRWQKHPVFIKVCCRYVAVRVERLLWSRQIRHRNFGLWPIFAGWSSRYLPREIFSYGTEVPGASRDFLLSGVLTMSALGFLWDPVAGHLRDRTGRGRLYIIAAAISGMFGFVYFALLDTRSPTWVFVAIAMRAA